MSKSKLYTRRDTVVAILRKMGIDKANYNKFISTPTSGTESGFYVDVVAAEASLKPTKKPQPKQKEPKSKEPTPKAKVKAKSNSTVHDELDAESSSTKPTSGKSISKIIQDMILNGMTNQQIWDVLKQQYGLDDSKKYYPAWNRSEMRRSGKLKEV